MNMWPAYVTQTVSFLVISAEYKYSNNFKYFKVIWWVLLFCRVSYHSDNHNFVNFDWRVKKLRQFASASVSILTFKEKLWALLEWKHFSNLLARHWDREHSKVKGMVLPMSVNRSGSQESGGLALSSNGTVFVGECAIMEARPLIQVFHQG